MEHLKNWVNMSPEDKAALLTTIRTSRLNSKSNSAATKQYTKQETKKDRSLRMLSKLYAEGGITQADFNILTTKLLNKEEIDDTGEDETVIGES
jgi:hypothetical protein